MDRLDWALEVRAAVCSGQVAGIAGKWQDQLDFCITEWENGTQG